MIELLAWLEGSGLGRAIRGAGVWSYAVFNLAHILGVATLFGSVLLLDLKLLGAFPRSPLAAISRPAVMLASAGFGLAAASGLCLLATNASEYGGNPFLPIKFAAILAALLNVLLLHRSRAWRAHQSSTPSGAERLRLRIGGAVSMIAWTTAITCGRMLGYW